MSSISLYQKKARGQNSGWGAWQQIGGVDYVSSGNAAYVVYSANVSLDGGSTLQSVSVATNFVCRTGAHYSTLRCFVFNFDPTGSQTIPYTYAAGYAEVTQYVPNYGVYQVFTISGLNITTNKIYLWFEDVNNSAYMDDLYSYNTGNGYTGTPAIQGTFSLPTMSLGISPSAVTTGNGVTITVEGGSGYNMTATFKYGSTVLTSGSFTSGAATVLCSPEWFYTAGITSARSMNVTVEVTGAGNTLTGSFTLNAGSSMTPSIGTVSKIVVQPPGSGAAQYYPDTFIANISSAKIRMGTVQAYYGATIGSVKVSYNGITVTASVSGQYYEATTAAPLTENTTFTMTVTDSRGLSSSYTTSASVVSYSPPTITLNEIFRCNANGVSTSGGAYYRIRATGNIYTGLSGNAVTEIKCKRVNISTYHTLTNGVLSSALDGGLQLNSGYTIEIVVKDKVSGEVKRTVTLSGARRDFVLTRDAQGTHLGIGITPGQQNDSNVIYPNGTYLEMPDGAAIIAGTAFAVLAGFSLPANPVSGQFFLHINTTNRTATLKRYTGSAWENYTI